MTLDLTEKRSIVQILRVSLKLCLRRPMLLAAVGGVVVVPYDAIVLIVTQRGLFEHPHSHYNLFTPANAAAVLVIAPVIAAITVSAVATMSEGRGSEAVRAMRASVRRLPLAVTTQLVSYIGVGLAGIFFVIPGILLALRWCVAGISVAMEGRGLRGALGRSSQLANGSYWRIFGVTIAVEAVALSTAFGVSGLVGDNRGGGGVVAIEVVVQMIVATYAGLTLAILYFDLCARAHSQSIALEVA